MGRKIDDKVAELIKKAECLSPAQNNALIVALVLNQPHSKNVVQELPPAQDDLLTVEEAAKKLSLTKQNVYELVRKKELPAIKIGKYKRIDPSDLKRWINQHKNSSIDL